MKNIRGFVYCCTLTAGIDTLDTYNDDEWNNYTFAAAVKESLRDEDCMWDACQKMNSEGTLWPPDLNQKFVRGGHPWRESGFRYDDGTPPDWWLAILEDRWEFHRYHRRMVQDFLDAPQFQSTLSALLSILALRPDYPYRHLTAEELLIAKQSYTACIQPSSSSKYRREVFSMCSALVDGGGVGYDDSAENVRDRNIYLSLAHEWKHTIAGSCTPDMVDMLACEWKDIPLVPLTLDDLPTQSGWLYLEKPLMLPCEVSGTNDIVERPIRAMSWHTVSGLGVDDPIAMIQDVANPDNPNPLVTVLSLYADIREVGLLRGSLPDGFDPLQPSSDEHTKTYGRLVNGALARSMNDVFVLCKDDVQWSEFKAQGEVSLVWDVMTVLDVPSSIMEERHDESFLFLLKAFQALWALMQDIAVVKTVPVYGKKRGKSGKERTVTNVIVVDLPKTYSSAAGLLRPEFKGVLTYRFPVRSHWRRIRDKDGTVVKRVRVKAHMKGPEDGELILKHRVLRVRDPLGSAG